MDKKGFLSYLKKTLSCLPREDIDERLNFYSEMIDDYVEEGLTEEEAVNRIGPVDEIAAQIIGDTHPSNSQAGKPVKKLSAAKIILIILCSPIWISLLAAAFSVAISLLAAFWAIIISLWSVFAGLACSAIGVLIGGIVLIITGHASAGAAAVGTSLVCAGLSIFTYFGCRAATIAAVKLTKWIVKTIINHFKKKEDLNNV